MTDKVTVTQADREAAGKAYENSRGASATMHSLIVSGRNDGYYLVQAFARHRIEATRQAEEQIKLLREALGELVDACDGEVSEVFAGEIGAELSLAVAALEATNQ